MRHWPKLSLPVVMTHKTRYKPPQMGTIKITRKMIKTIPTLFGEADVIKACKPNRRISGTEGLAGMYVRGGNGDENLYMIDGIQLYQVNHLGGLFSAFNAEALKDVDFL